MPKNRANFDPYTLQDRLDVLEAEFATLKQRLTVAGVLDDAGVGAVQSTGAVDPALKPQVIDADASKVGTFKDGEGKAQQEA